MSLSASLVAAFGLLSLAAVVQAQTSETPSIVTQGEATITVAPDRAFIQLAAEGRAPKAAEAQRIAAEAMASLQAAVRGAGVTSDAIRTTGYSLAAEYDWPNGKQTFRAYVARNQVEVRVDDLSKLSTILDAGGTSGASSISGLRFDLKDRTSVEQTALKQAVADALSRATAIAAGASHTLGPIIRIQEQRVLQPSPIQYRTTMAAEASRATPIEPGEIEIRAEVVLTVAIAGK